MRARVSGRLCRLGFRPESYGVRVDIFSARANLSAHKRSRSAPLREAPAFLGESGGILKRLRERRGPIFFLFLDSQGPDGSGNGAISCSVFF